MMMIQAKDENPVYQLITQIPVQTNLERKNKLVVNHQRSKNNF